MDIFAIATYGMIAATIAIVVKTVIDVRRAQKKTNEQIQEIDSMVQELQKYRLMTIEQIQDVWLAYDSIKGDFLGQSQDLAGLEQVAQRRWPEKIVLARVRDQEKVYVAHAPENLMAQALVEGDSVRGR